MSDPLHIAYVCSDRGVAAGGMNGAATHLREFVGAVMGRGAAVTLLTSRMPAVSERSRIGCDLVDIDADPFPALLRRQTVHAAGENCAVATQASEVHGLLLNVGLSEALAGLHRRRPVDLVYERYSLWSLAGLEFARREGVPFFVEFNAPLAAQQEEYRSLVNASTAHALGDLLLAHADRVITPSRELAAHVVERVGRPGRMRVIPCGVSRDLFLPHRALPRPVPGRGEFVVGFLGSLKPWHGLELLLEAFRELRTRDAGYHLLLVGDGPLRATIEQFCRAHLPAGSVTITGAVPHERVPEYLARMDAGVAPYPELPLFYFSPLKVFEYAAASVPIVASASGQIATVFAHKDTALLHPPGKVGKIVKHIEQLRLRPDLGPRLARRARRVVSRGYTWDRLAARLLTMAHNARRRPVESRKENVR